MRPGVEVLIDEDERPTTGEKRNRLLARAQGIYTVFIDADDGIAPDYIYQILNAAEGAQVTDTKIGLLYSGPGAIVFEGIYTKDGRNPQKFKLSKDYEYTEKDNVYYRYPNHIVPIRRDISTRFKFPHKSYGEDYEWATAIHNSGLIQEEVKIQKDLYFYNYITKRR